jgi:TPR repeat protein/serine/threonine protein kinase
MAAHYALLRFVAKAALNHVGFGVAGDFAIEVLPELVKDVWKWWSKDRTPQQLRDDVQAVAALPQAEVHKQAIEAVNQEAVSLPPMTREKLTIAATYLAQIPGAIARSQSRPSDPTGRTVSSQLALTRPEDLIPLLPVRVPKFKAGDRPPGVGDWELVELLGMGGFGEVWKAKNPHFDGIPPVALKFCLDEKAAKALKNEGQLLARVQVQKNPAIVPLLHSYLGATPPCLEYEYVAGGDLTALIYRHLQQHQGKAVPEYARKVIRSLAGALSHAHRLTPPIVHRDIKPANVLVQRKADGSGTLRVADFGIGGVAASQAIEQAEKATTTHGMTVLSGAHTPNYASPQQKRGMAPDPRDDVHALGVMWYQMLIGDLNKGAPAGMGWRKALVERGMGVEELDLLQACFDEDPTSRPRDAKELADRIDQIRKAVPVVTVASSPNPTVYGQAVTLRAAVKASSPSGAPTGTVTFKVGDNTLSSAALVVGTASLTIPALPAGTHSVVASYGGDANFAAGSSVPLNQTVRPAPLTVKASEASKTAGQPNPAFSATFSGFVNGEGASSLRGTLSFTTPATDNTPAGTYPVTPGGVSSPNYDVTFVPGSLVVHPDPVQQFDQNLKEAIEEWKTKGTPDAYFERQAPGRIVAWRAAAQQGNAVAQWLLARCLYGGFGIEAYPQVAVTWLRKAAETGLAVAQNDLGDCFYYGEVVEENLTESFRWFCRAADQGFAEAQRNVGDCYLHGDGVKEDAETAVRWYHAAANKGWVEAQTSLGDCYRDGVGIEQHHAEAVRWYRKAADAGYPEAQLALGVCYALGEGVPKDPAEAVRWYRKAAESGNPEGENLLGMCYFKGEGVEQDDPQAIGWFRKAAEQGLPIAQVNLGGCYDRGRGVKKDWPKAVEWFRKAAEQGNDEGQFCLGFAYEKGRGVGKDLAQAEQWYRKAADQEHRRAKNALKRLSKGEPPKPEDDDQEEGDPAGSAESQYFNSFLRAAGLAPSDVRLIRHADGRAEKGRWPYDLWHKNRPQFEWYQSTQGFDKRARLTAPYWAVFLGTPDGKTMFVGLYSVRYQGLLKQATPKPHRDGVDEAGSCDVYDLTRQDALSQYIGKLFIEWGSGALAWIQYADKNEKPITEIRS